MSELAEREGFEPPIRFPVYTLSRRAPSATRPSLRDILQISEMILAARKLCRVAFDRRGRGDEQCFPLIGLVRDLFLLP